MSKKTKAYYNPGYPYVQVLEGLVDNIDKRLFEFKTESRADREAYVNWRKMENLTAVLELQKTIKSIERIAKTLPALFRIF